MGGRFRALALGVVAVIGLSGCALTETEAPPLAGPSELALALSLFANPDVLSQDGASQSQIVIQARDASGQPAANVPIRAEITVEGVVTDFGRLSARTLVTGMDGRANLTYTAPLSATGNTASTTITIRVAPSSTDSSNTVFRTVDIRLVPPGVIDVPFGTPIPSFTASNLTPAAFTSVTFDASASTDPDGTITSFAWNFGDGTTGSGAVVTHQFNRPGNFLVTLTVTDNNGFSASRSQTVLVGPGAAPTAAFNFSPTAPTVQQDIFFNASASRPGTGRTLVRYDWGMGDGTTLSGVTVTKRYSTPGTYTVTLTVTDDVGQTATTTLTVVVSATGPGGINPTFTVSPTTGKFNQPMFFNASSSTAPAGIVSYEWNWGDGTPDTISSTPTQSHTFTGTTATTFIVRLTIRDSNGATASTTQQVIVNP